ncbi:Hpt domain-containing protein [Streptomyces sp. NPDC126514]|uniref:Hpt domain-containing protein n=1 Tax=Streptomyces sp. NPDC126514 TaxID=3155210 RepID=UPI003326B622
MPAAQVMNQQTVVGLVEELDAAFTLELIETFLQDSPQLVRQIREGIQENDPGAVRRAAHTLKSNSVTFGLEQLAPLCQKLERLAAGGSLPQSAALASGEIEVAHRLAQDALLDIKQKLAENH